MGLQIFRIAGKIMETEERRQFEKSTSPYIGLARVFGKSDN